MPITSGGVELDRRVHVRDPRLWGTAAASDFWIVCNNEDQAAAGSSDLVGYGWISSGGVYLAGSAADFLSSADKGVPGGLHMDTASDTVSSPFIFGDHAHLSMVEDVLGYTPTTLSAEFYMYLSANNDEVASGAGFWAAGSTSGFATTDSVAVVCSGGTNFELQNLTPAEDAGSADNTTPHVFKITITVGSTIEWWIDGTSQGTLALVTDSFPCSFGVNTQAGGSNDPVLAWAHVSYA